MFFAVETTCLDVLLGLWAIVNNAGIGPVGLIEWQTVEEMKQVLDVNLWGMVSVTKAFLPQLKKTKGRIVNVASTWGTISLPSVTAYCISKHGVQAFCDSLRREVKQFGVSVHILDPGMFRTNLANSEMAIKQVEKLWANLDVDTKKSYGGELNLGK